MLITRAIPEDHRTPERIEDYLTRFKADYGRHWKTATRPYPGIEDLLHDLLQRGIPRAVVTNKPHAFAERCVQHFFPDTPFQMIRGQKERCPSQAPPAAGARSREAFAGLTTGMPDAGRQRRGYGNRPVRGDAARRERPGGFARPTSF